MNDNVNNTEPKPPAPDTVPIERLVDDILGVQWRKPDAHPQTQILQILIGRAVTNLVIAHQTNSNAERFDAIARAHAIITRLAVEGHR